MIARRAVVVVVAAAVVGGAGWWVHARASAGAPDAAGRPALPTVAVLRGDLVATLQQPGQLGYAGSYTVVGQRAGTVTAAPRPGHVIKRGQQAYAVDQRPIPLLYGSLPVYRPLVPGAEGADVAQLERNLVALGYDDLTVDDRYTAATARAVRRWQDDLGVPQTGTVAPGDAVVAAAEVRVDTVNLLVGASAQPGAAVLTGTGTGHSAFVELPVAARGYARPGQVVSIQLPDTRTVRGKIVSVGAAAADQPADTGGTAAQSGGQASGCPAGQGSGCPQSVTVEAQVTSPPAELGGLDQGPVSVTFSADTRRGVLSVPIAALTIGPAGDFAVVVVDGTGRRVVPVRTGLFTAGRVEISGDGVAEGARVEVPTL
jgi:peptidoglycan hydrolase-like protein with peptidoglycan-binding domain